MMVTYENNIKRINGKTLEEVLNTVDPNNRYNSYLKLLFDKVETLEELKFELKEIYKERSPVFIISLIMRLCSCNMSEANDIAEDIFVGNGA